MADLYITEHGISLHRSGESLLLKKDGTQFKELELKNIETIQIFGYAQASSQVLFELLERGIELAFYNSSGNLIGQLTPPHVKNIELRMKQYDLSKNESFKLDFGKEMIQGKMESCIYLLEEFGKNSEFDFRSEILALKDLKSASSLSQNIESLLGFEGIFAKRYYENYGKLFREKGLFNGRSRRPPKDAANSVLSLLYTILTNRISAYIDGIGFDPYIGFLHSLEYGRLSLGCDMIEPLRPLFCDWFTLKLFNQKRIKPEDFRVEDNGYYLDDLSRKKFYPLLHNELKENRDYLYLRGELLDWVKMQTEWLKTVFLAGSVTSFKEYAKAKQNNGTG
ncbi:MAG TPA: CRISPR-associated endonuclease Cas1 [Leptospiraceae bacterium]|nr:CRISPR-associated endonuclease Cas1 [Leptospiraceae bacterium]HMW06640.1 CRISPR-associated endonuclease Cas1 [Leptospiraceae bacterium]HMY32705.1 CRISPR-associated endonuclease Cas1 [Leptospiraceae bacterium]HMZ64895.1 CRISPR-associated endonuclease Cas1 [Leptospiraceae bacterium]HNA05376.1 CRISPR-associated endonuclease Cas1 [Leptospiraceae bacterium]